MSAVISDDQHDEQRTFICEECGKRYNKKSDLTRHHDSVHMGIRYPCGQCDYQFDWTQPVCAHG